MLDKQKANNIEVPSKSVCGICGDSHYYRDCKYVIITAKVSDRNILTRARLSLPDVLEIKTLADKSTSVFTRNVIEVGTEFGPFVARRNLTLHPTIVFPIKIFTHNESDLSEYYLDTTDENECCWMMFVQPASDVEEQNLICYQEGDAIFYGAIRDILPGKELKVWYSPYLAQKMQTKLLTFRDSHNLQLELEISKSNKTELNTIIKKQQKIIPRTVWSCKFCYKSEKTVPEFAVHLIAHYTSKKKWMCQPCQSKFQYVADYRRHLKLFHGQDVIVEKAQSTANVAKSSITISDQEAVNTAVGGPLLFQCLSDNLDNSNSLLPQPHQNFPEMDNNYENQNLLLDSDNLRLNVDVMGNMDLVSSESMANDQENSHFLCDICSKKFSSLRSIAEHLKLHTGKYFCRICKKVFGRTESFKYHKCNQIFSIKCSKCERLFYQKKFLIRHISLHHERKFSCSACNTICYSKIELKRHNCKKAMHKCATCPETFYSYRGLRIHTKKHTKDSSYTLTYICAECGHTFSAKNTYDRHVKSVHNKVNSFDCPICDKIFNRRDSLNKHLINIHMSHAANIKCPQCDTNFKTKKYLNEHIKLSHTATKFHCDQCSTSFKYSRNLLRHKKLLHKDRPLVSKEDAVELHKCPVCDVKVKLKRSLQRHIREKHPEKYKSLAMEIRAKSDELKQSGYKCPICKHQVQQKASLRMHISKKHPNDVKSVCAQLNNSVSIVDKGNKDEEFDNCIDLQKTIENMDFNNIDHDNLLSGDDIIDKFLKESSDQISILFADSPKNSNANCELLASSNTTDRGSNKEVGLSMPDLSELDIEIRPSAKHPRTVLTNSLDAQLSLPSADVVLYVLNE